MKEKFKIFIRWFAPLALWFALLFTGLRIYEHLSSADLGNKLRLESSGFLYDWPFTARLILIVTVITFASCFIGERAGKAVAFTLFLIFLITGFCLIHYFSVTNVLLSTDLFGYTLDDITTTVSSSEGFSFVSIFSLLFYVGAFTAGAVFFLRRKEISLKVCIAMLAAIVIVAALPVTPTYEQFTNESEYSLVENKSRYFYNQAVRYIRDESAIFTNVEFHSNKKYPFLKSGVPENVLGKYFSRPDSLPNFVFILIEGMGKDFTGPNASWGGFTPFLDSLSEKSLYWTNALSNAGRTFGALPSVLGSLPYGKNGFMSYGVDMADHQSLLSILKNSGYETHFFYGGNPGFDQQDLFMQYQGIDYTLNESNFPPSYMRESGNAAYAWGFPDRKVLQASLEILNERKALPRADVYLTLSTHEPFVTPEKEFEETAEKIIDAEPDPARKEQLTEFKSVFSCLLYTDDAIREFISDYKRRPEFMNTIFIITGDHRLVPVPQASKLSRFRVPLLIWSPLLKEPEMFQSIVLHSDIFPSLLAYLSEDFGVAHTARLPFLSSGLRTDTVFFSDAEIGLMRSKGSVQDYISGEHFLSEGNLFKILPDMDLQPVSNSDIRSQLQQKLRRFAWESKMVCEENRLDSLNRPNPLRVFSFTSAEKEIIEDEDLEDQNPEEIFNNARKIALKNDFEKSRVLLRYLLNGKPNFHDARVLLSRTFAWDKQYDTARVFLKQVLDRSPYYEDAYNAYADIAFWKGETSEASAWTEKGLTYHPASLDLLARRARALWTAGDLTSARSLTEKILKQNSKHELALEMDQKLKQ